MLKKSLSDIRLSDKEKEVLITYADNDMNMARTAQTLFMVRGSIEYYLEKITSSTGYNPRKFYDLLELLYFISSEVHLEQEEAV